jgi:fatty acid desaturase
VLPQQVRLRALLKSGIIDPIGIYWTIAGSWRTATGKLDGEWNTELFTKKHRDQRAAYHQWSRVCLIGHGTLCVVCLATGWWPVAVAVSFGRFFGSGLQFLCNSTQHIGLVDEYPDFRVACRTFTMNPVLEFLYWNMNYHTEHHMFAGVPCYNLRRLHRAIRHELPPVTNGLIETWSQIHVILKRQAAEPGYHYWPEVPACPVE